MPHHPRHLGAELQIQLHPSLLAEGGAGQNRHTASQDDQQTGAGVISVLVSNIIVMNHGVKVWFEGDWPWGENWILCDQLAMLACLYPECVKRSSSLPAR